MFPSQEALLTKYLEGKNLEEAVLAVKDMKAPKHFLAELLRKLVVCSLERPDEDQELTSALIQALCADGLVTGDILIQVTTLCQRHDYFKRNFSLNCNLMKDGLIDNY